MLPGLAWPGPGHGLAMAKWRLRRRQWRNLVVPRNPGPYGPGVPRVPGPAPLALPPAALGHGLAPPPQACCPGQALARQNNFGSDDELSTYYWLIYLWIISTNSFIQLLLNYFKCELISLLIHTCKQLWEPMKSHGSPWKTMTKKYISLHMAVQGWIIHG